MTSTAICATRAFVLSSSLVLLVTHEEMTDASGQPSEHDQQDDLLFPPEDLSSILTGWPPTSPMPRC